MQASQDAKKWQLCLRHPRYMAEVPLSLTDGTSFQGKKKNAEPVTRSNALAWRQPFCTTSGGTDRHREALPLSWHRPDPRPWSSN